MAVLAISVLGAGLGSAAGIGASAGWLIGSLVGNLLFPTKGPNTEGPRLTDLSVQSATEGADIPLIYGRMRVAGNMIWSGGIREVRTKKKQGGKGMGGSSTHTSYTYNASFAIGLCEGPIQGVRKIWADGKLIYDNSSNASAATLYVSKKKAGAITIYRGTETQTADSVIAASVGAADCPAFRGLAYIVFSQLQLADFGNRIPNITAEVVTGTEGAYLWRVNTWPQTLNTYQKEIENGVVRAIYRENVSGANVRRRVHEYDFAGNKIRDTYGPTVAFPSGTTNEGYSIQGKPRIALWRRSSQNIVNAMYWLLDDAESAQDVNIGQYGDTRSMMTDNPAGVYLNGYIFWSISNLDMDNSNRRAANGVARWPVSRTLVPARSADRFVNLAAMGLCTPRGNTSYVVRRITPTDEGTLLFLIHLDNVISYQIVEFDIDLNFIKGYTLSGAAYNDTSFGVRNGRYYVQASQGELHLQLFEEQSSGVYTYLKQTVQNDYNVILQSAGNGLLFARDGMFQIYPPVTPPTLTVGSIVSDLCTRCGLTTGDIDVTSLTDTVTGYAVGRTMSGRSAIQPLAQAWPFDAVESDGIVRFVRRPGTVRATLTADDLGAGLEQPAAQVLMKNRQQELELPAEVRVKYFDSTNDYQPGVQPAKRISSTSRNVIDVDLPIALSSTQAAQIADILLRNAWAERDTYELTLTRRYLRLDPCDLVTLPDGTQARITSTDYTEPAVIRMEATREINAGYSSIEVGNDSAHDQPQELAIAGPTRIEFLDVPPLRDADSGAGFYVAACGYFTGWRGCELLRSEDGGASYQYLTAIVDEATMGATTTALGAPESVNTFDLARSVTVDLVTPGATLSGITDAQMLAGGNACLIGSEILQFGVATLNGDGTYTLSRLLRGRLGTEAHVGTHVSGERFVLLDSNILRIDDGQANNNVSLLYRAITFGDALDEGTEELFTSTGRTQQNPAPGDLFAAIEYADESWLITWKRRNRLTWWMADSGDAPLDNVTEAYEIEIRDMAGVLKNTYTSSTRSYSYTKAQQIADFGAGVVQFIYRVKQVCDGGVRGLSAEATATPAARGRYLSGHRTLGPILYWRNIFDATPDDDSGNNYDGTSSGTFTANQTDIPIVNEASSTAFKSCIMGGGYLQRADSGSPLLDITAVVSLSVWVKFTVTDNTRTIMGKWDGSVAADQAYRLQIGTSTGSLRFQVNIGGTVRSSQHAGSYNDGNWHHVVGVYDSTGTVSLYVDGVLRGTPGTGAYVPIQSGAANFRVGQNSNGTEVYNGSVCEVAVHAKALTATVIENLYKNARGLP